MVTLAVLPLRFRSAIRPLPLLTPLLALGVRFSVGTSTAPSSTRVALAVGCRIQLMAPPGALLRRPPLHCRLVNGVAVPPTTTLPLAALTSTVAGITPVRVPVVWGQPSWARPRLLPALRPMPRAGLSRVSAGVSAGGTSVKRSRPPRESSSGIWLPLRPAALAALLMAVLMAAIRPVRLALPLLSG